MKKATKYYWYIGVQIFIGVFLWVPFMFMELNKDVIIINELLYGIVYGLANVFVFIGLRKLLQRAKRFDADEEYLSRMIELVYNELDPMKATESSLITWAENSFEKDKPETIVRAADKDNDGYVWSVKIPGGHGHINFYRCSLNIHDLDTKQGFVTSRGRFVDRVEGWTIASENNQIIRNIGTEGKLFSEHMWYPNYH